MNKNEEHFYRDLRSKIDELPLMEASERDWNSFKQFQQAQTLESNNKKGGFWFFITNLFILTAISSLFSFQISQPEVGAYFFKPQHTPASFTQYHIASPKHAETSILSEGQLTAMADPTEGITLTTDKLSQSKPVQNTLSILPEEPEIKKNPALYPGEREIPELENVGEKSLSNLGLIVAFNEIETRMNSNTKRLIPLSNLAHYSAAQVSLKSKRAGADFINIWGIASKNQINQTPTNYGAGFQLGKYLGKGFFVGAGIELMQEKFKNQTHFNHSFNLMILLKSTPT